MVVDIGLIIKSFFIGFILATPVGASSIICMRRLLTKGYTEGFVSALGIAFGDLFYASIAVFSLSVISDLIIKYQIPIRFIGGAILLVLGSAVYIKKKPIIACSLQQVNYFKLFSSTFFLTISNPLIIIFLATILTTMGMQRSPETTLGVLTMLFCIFAGSISWWVLIIGGCLIFKYQPTPSVIQIINKASGALLILSGIIFVIKSIHMFLSIKSVLYKF